MPKGYPLDLDAIHELLWNSRDRHGRVQLSQVNLAEDLDVTKFTMSRTITKMIAEKRIRQVSNKRQNKGVFVVEEPGEWQALYGTPE